MGVGKSTIGKLLAKRLKAKFIDVDKVIEKNEKKSIKNIFEERGEKYFRKLERKITLKFLKNKKAVIALGGGAFINKDIREVILKSSKSVWLKVGLNNLIKRYKNNNRRPLLNKKISYEDVEKIYLTRKKIYSLADFKVNCDNMDKAQIVQKILNFYEN